MKAPFIYFGGKGPVTNLVWEALGDVDNYVEPFAGSLAVLLNRPGERDGRIETVNDVDHFLTNFWRALASDPISVAEHADWPVNEDDLFARHMWLVSKGRGILESGISSDPDFFDTKIAGWWVWGINAWIGGGWCSGRGPWHVCEGGVAKFSECKCKEESGDLEVEGVTRSVPYLKSSGQGVNRKLPSPESPRYIPDTLHHPTIGPLLLYFEELAERMRKVRVCTGDWERVVTRGALSGGATVGVFLDPPYSGDVREQDLYAAEDYSVSKQVREWAVEHGDDPRMRIVMAGYSEEHDDDFPDSWRRIRWSASASYQTSASAKTEGGNSENRHKEVLWLSPACEDKCQGELWG